MCGSVNKSEPGPAEGENAVLLEIAAVESSCTTRLNYTVGLQALLAENGKKKKAFDLCLLQNC